MEGRSLFPNKILLKYVGLKNKDKEQGNLWKFPLRSLLCKI